MMSKKNTKKKKKSFGFNSEEENIAQRRESRLNAIIAIVAIIVTFIYIMCKCLTDVLNLWSTSDGMIIYLQILVVCAATTIFMILVRLIWFGINDLKRFDLMTNLYVQYDIDSDKRYQNLLYDIKLYMGALMVVFLIMFPVSFLYNKNDRIVNVIMMVMLGVLGLVMIADNYKKCSVKDVGKKFLKIGEKLFLWFVVAVFVYLLGVGYLLIEPARINVNYSVDGLVTIEHKSPQKISQLEIVICEGDEIIYTESVNETDLLCAVEETHIVRYDDGDVEYDGVLINSSSIHCKYMFDINRVGFNDGEYQIKIKARQAGRYVMLIDDFVKMKAEYFFAQDNISKVY